MNLGDRIQAARVAKDLNMKAAAERIGVSPSAISEWERNLRAPHVESLKALCEELEISADELLDLPHRARPSLGDRLVIQMNPNRCQTIVKPIGPEADTVRQCEHAGRYNGKCGMHRR